MKKHILFVDDEPNVVQGLCRMMRPQREKWDISFAESGSEALHLIQKKPIDVIVSDMRMPGMDGPTLLTQIQDKYPEVLRIVLSGQSDQEMTLRSIGPAHKFLNKPCDAGQIKDTLSQIFTLQNLVTSDSVRAFIHGIKSIPSQPAIYTQIQKEVEKEDFSILRIAELINADPAMCVKILQIVNSAFFGIPRSISNPVEAVTILGSDVIKSLVLAVGVFSQFERNTLPGVSIERFWAEALTVGHFANSIAVMENADKEFIQQAQLSGMLHAIGKLILAQNFPEQYAQVQELINVDRIDIVTAEEKVFDCNHAQVGAYLIGLWGLPDDVVEAIAYYHRPSDCTQSTTFSPLTCVHAANTINANNSQNNYAETVFDMEHLSRIDMTDRLEQWLTLPIVDNERTLR